jgi:hypothetical protein
MLADGWPCDGVKRSRQHQDRHRGADRHERRGSEFRPTLADAVVLQAIQHARAGRKRIAIMRTIAAFDSDVRRVVHLRCRGSERGSENLPETLAVTVVHGRDQARQARIGRGIVDQTADERLDKVEVRLARSSGRCISGGTVTISGDRASPDTVCR